MTYLGTHFGVVGRKPAVFGGKRRLIAMPRKFEPWDAFSAHGEENK
jgi:hypothetical protein